MILFTEKMPTIVMDLPSSQITKEGDQLELRLVTDGIGTYHCKWLFNEKDDVILNGLEVVLTIEDHNKICCLRIKHFQTQHAGKYQAVLENAAGVLIKSKITVCQIGKDSELINNEHESPIIGIHVDISTSFYPS